MRYFCYTGIMTSTITTSAVADLAARAGIEAVTGHNLHIVAAGLTDWARDISDGDYDYDAIPAVDALEAIAQTTAYVRIGADLQGRCDAGEFDAWAPLWTAA